MTIANVEQLKNVLDSYGTTFGPDYIVLSQDIVHQLEQLIQSGNEPLRVAVLSPSVVAVKQSQFRSWNLLVAVSVGCLARQICDASSECRDLAINYIQYDDLAEIITSPIASWQAYQWTSGDLPSDECPPWNASQSATPTDDTPPQSKS